MVDGGEWTLARQALWTYRTMSEDDQGEHEFFAALEPEVAAEISRRCTVPWRVAVGRELHLQVGTYSIRARLTNLEPLLADVMDSRTEVLARYDQSTVDGRGDISAFISEVVRYPNERQGVAFESLVGLDLVNVDIVRKLASLLAPGRLDSWARHAYGHDPPEALLQAAGV